MLYAVYAVVKPFLLSSKYRIENGLGGACSASKTIWNFFVSGKAVTPMTMWDFSRWWYRSPRY